MGTEGFAAPEQFGRRQTDSRSDIYALGTILNYMILRKFPVEEIVGGKLGAVIRRCIFVNPDERYQNVKELEQALEQLYPSAIEEKKTGENTEKQMLPGWHRFLPPGFRSGKVWKMVVAILGYLMIINILLSVELIEDGVPMTGRITLLQKILLILSQFVEIGFLFNYLGCRDSTPLLNSKNPFIRIAGYVILEFLLLLIAIILWDLLDMVV